MPSSNTPNLPDKDLPMEQNHQPQVEVSNARIAATQLGFDGAAMFGTLQLQAQGFGVGFSGHVLHVEAQTQEQADYQRHCCK
ncbi:hypothetical protein U9070_25360 [Escherichia coli]